jgi:hypothetical protein
VSYKLLYNFIQYLYTYVKENPLIQDLDSKKNIARQAATLEGLVDNLDQRGLLVLQVMLGQQAMKLLSEKHVSDVTKPKVLKPD